MNTNQKGSVTEAAVLAALTKQGKKVLVPFGNYGDYDLIIDDGSKFLKVQCKTGRLARNKSIIKFNNGVHASKGDRYYRDSIDFYGVYCPDLDKTYFVPASQCAMTNTILRLTPSKNNHKNDSFGTGV